MAGTDSTQVVERPRSPGKCVLLSRLKGKRRESFLLHLLFLKCFLLGTINVSKWHISGEPVRILFSGEVPGMELEGHGALLRCPTTCVSHAPAPFSSPASPAGLGSFHCWTLQQVCWLPLSTPTLSQRRAHDRNLVIHWKKTSREFPIKPRVLCFGNTRETERRLDLPALSPLPKADSELSGEATLSKPAKCQAPESQSEAAGSRRTRSHKLPPVVGGEVVLL